jgi:hypothetical protein
MRLAQMPSVRQRVAVVLGEVFPTPPAMRYWEWIRRTERAALTLGYLYRPFWFAFKLPDAYRASRAANICSVRTSALGSAHERAREGFRAPDRFG